MVYQLRDLENEVKRRWSEDPVAEMCLRLIRYMRDQPNQNLRMLTYLNIGEILNHHPLNENVQRAITILVSSKIHALEKRFLFIDDETYEEYEIQYEDIEEANHTGLFIHPRTGEEVKNFESKIVPFFVPSQEFIELKRKQYAGTGNYSK
mgnify:CR=1 FL=1